MKITDLEHLEDLENSKIQNSLGQELEVIMGGYNFSDDDPPEPPKIPWKDPIVELPPFPPVPVPTPTPTPIPTPPPPPPSPET